MRTLTLRIYLTVVLVLMLFALAAHALFQHQLEVERERAQQQLMERTAGLARWLQHALPPADAEVHVQTKALAEWSARLDTPLALDDAHGDRLAATEAYIRRAAEPGSRPLSFEFDDGRRLLVLPRRSLRSLRPLGARALAWPWLPPWLSPAQAGQGAALLLLLLFLAVAASAWPVARALTRRLQALRASVEAFGQGDLGRRADERGQDDVAALAKSFNQAAQAVHDLLRAHRSLLANASHELRSPLARMKMAVHMHATAQGAQRERLAQEIATNLRELDDLVDELLLASRLDATSTGAPLVHAPVDVLGLVAEEAARLGFEAHGEALIVPGDDKLLRRAVRNLLENAQRYGQQGVSAQVLCRSSATTGTTTGASHAIVRVSDRGPGVPAELRERIFEAFFRLPGHAEQAGGVGLGLSLVRQIARAHGGEVLCLESEGGGGCFEISLPLSSAATAA